MSLIESKPLLPPHDKEAEECILGMALAFNFLPDLGVMHIYDASLRRIFSAIECAAMDGKRIDYAGILPYLPAQNKVEDAIRAADIQEQAPHQNNQEYYERRVRASAHVREALRFAMEIQSRIQQGKQTDELLDWVRMTAAGIGIDDEPVEADIQSIADQYTQEILAAAEAPEKMPGLRTGIAELDRLTCGMRSGQLWVICARPSVGKSAMAHNIARRAAQDRIQTLICSAEQTRREVFMRLLADVTSVGSESWLTWKGMATQTKLLAGRDELKRASLFIVDRKVRTDADCIREARRYRPRILIVDYLQMFSSAVPERNRVLELGKITKTLKNWAKDSNGTCVLLAQLNRQIELRDDKLPRLSDLRDSGEVEQDADVVIGLARDYLATDIPEGYPQEAKMTVIKNRDGKCGTFPVNYFPSRCVWGSTSKMENKGD